jgi:hypothetical protein
MKISIHEDIEYARLQGDEHTKTKGIEIADR